MKSISSAAITRLTELSHFTPPCSPVKAETTKAAPSTTMISSWSPVVFSTPAVSWSPVAIWRAPMPRLVAVPKTVAKTASRSSSRPMTPLARRSPMSGMKTALIRLPRPSRKVVYARERPTTP